MKAQIVGWSHLPFGKREEPDVEALMSHVTRGALQHAGIEPQAVDGIFVGVMNNGFSKQGFEAGLVALSVPQLSHVPATHVENACATGSAAIYTAMDFIEAGRGRIALVVGAEKMTALPTNDVGNVLLCAS
jgi:acetyl-CoA C-acetyltransferase